VYSQVLIGISLVLAAYQDVRSRSVLDLVWLPAATGGAYALVVLYPSIELQLLKIALIGGVALAFGFLGVVGQADAIALVALSADPYVASPVTALVAVAVVALVHIGYEFATGEARGVKSMSLERFQHEQKWIPKAFIADGTRHEVGRDVNDARDEVKGGPGTVVEAIYGVPTVAYVGIGYLVYLLYMVTLNQAAFISLP
jgi:hypothetical protein